VLLSRREFVLFVDTWLISLRHGTGTVYQIQKYSEIRSALNAEMFTLTSCNTTIPISGMSYL